MGIFNFKPTYHRALDRVVHNDSVSKSVSVAIHKKRSSNLVLRIRGAMPTKESVVKTATTDTLFETHYP